MNKPTRVAGIAWFQPDTYDSFRTILPDREWHSSYLEWQHAAEQALKQLHDQGVVTVKAQVHPADFVAWCASTGRHVNAKALNDFANEAALRVVRGQH